MAQKKYISNEEIRKYKDQGQVIYEDGQGQYILDSTAFEFNYVPVSSEHIQKEEISIKAHPSTEGAFVKVDYPISKELLKAAKKEKEKLIKEILKNKDKKKDTIEEKTVEIIQVKGDEE